MQKYLSPKTQCKYCGRIQALTCENPRDVNVRRQWDETCQQAFRDKVLFEVVAEVKAASRPKDVPKEPAEQAE